MMSFPVENNPQKQKRSRIVVNLGQQQPQQPPPYQPGQPQPYYGPGQPPYGMMPRRKRWPKVLGITGGILLLLVLGAFIFWQYYKGKPAYSLALLVDAAQRNDAAAFDKVVDTGKVVESFVPQVIDEATARLGTALTPELRRRVEALVPTLLPNVLNNLRGEVMKQIKEVTARAEGKPFFMVALSIPYIVDIKQEGDSALVKGKTGGRDLELTMQRTPENRWRVVAVKDATLARRIVDDISKFLPAIGTDIEREIEKRLPGILPGRRR